MIYINEWLPNPTGPDAAGEFVELYNSGASPANLDGWFLKASAKKTFPLTGQTIAARGYLLLMRSATKLSLKNTSETLSLYDASGHLIDQSSFAGAAPEGKSFSRVDYGTAGIQHFAFIAPTPDVANGVFDVQVFASSYPFSVPLNAQLNTAQFFAMMMGTAALLAALAIYFIHSNENLSQFFFGGNEDVRA